MLARFERLMEQAVEGSLRRVFPTSLQPVQLAKAAARAMEQAQVIGLRGVEVPNTYRLYVAPADLERFSEYGETLSRELSRYLMDYARERGLRPVAEPRVELVEDAGVRAGSVRAQARFVDLAQSQQSDVEAAIEGTRRMRLADLAGAHPGADERAAQDASLWLTDRLGLRVALPADTDIVRIGRAADNDVCLSNQRVSRYHAQLRKVESTWLVYDLDSTNGTFVDEQPVAASQPHIVRSGNTLRLGDHDLTVRAGPADSASWTRSI